MAAEVPRGQHHTGAMVKVLDFEVLAMTVLLPQHLLHDL